MRFADAKGDPVPVMLQRGSWGTLRNYGNSTLNCVGVCQHTIERTLKPATHGPQTAPMADE